MVGTRYKKHFELVVAHDTVCKDHFSNTMQVPKLTNCVLNIGMGKKAVVDRKQIFSALLAAELVAGQKATPTRAKKSIDKFKLREKMAIGCKVTLRNKNMYEFLDR